ncbi:MAG: hypothetical protein K5756_08175 [Clostridiales bacterium]|nr:hypothetical protein [Clostridiales bacterium]
MAPPIGGDGEGKNKPYQSPLPRQSALLPYGRGVRRTPAPPTWEPRIGTVASHRSYRQSIPTICSFGL